MFQHSPCSAVVQLMELFSCSHSLSSPGQRNGPLNHQRLQYQPLRQLRVPPATPLPPGIIGYPVIQRQGEAEEKQNMKSLLFFKGIERTRTSRILPSLIPATFSSIFNHRDCVSYLYAVMDNVFITNYCIFDNH